jgi:hypothetical protein
MVSLAGASEPLAAEIRVLPLPLISPPDQVAVPPEGTLTVPLPPSVPPPERLRLLAVEAVLMAAVPPDTLSVCALTGTEKAILPPVMVVVPSAE